MKIQCLEDKDMYVIRPLWTSPRVYLFPQGGGNMQALETKGLSSNLHWGDHSELPSLFLHL